MSTRAAGIERFCRPSRRGGTPKQAPKHLPHSAACHVRGGGGGSAWAPWFAEFSRLLGCCRMPALCVCPNSIFFPAPATGCGSAPKNSVAVNTCGCGCSNGATTAALEPALRVRGLCALTTLKCRAACTRQQPCRLQVAVAVRAAQQAGQQPRAENARLQHHAAPAGDAGDAARLAQHCAGGTARRVSL